MKPKKWKKHHKWFGLFLAFFILMFSLSGIILNHRSTFADVNISRRWLPETYHFDRWNNGLLRGSLTYRSPQNDTDVVLLYGCDGMWKTDREGRHVTGFNDGLPEGSDYRNLKGAVQTPDGSLFTAAQYGLYRHNGKVWQPVSLPLDEGERLTDLTVHADTLVALGRNALYLSVAPYRHFSRVALQSLHGYDGKVSLFRTVWMLHSGELFGIAGQLLMDGVALILIFLCLTGFAYWFLPKLFRRLYGKGRSPEGVKHLLRDSLLWHDKVGRYGLVVLLFVAFTGWCLRPPVLLALASGEVPPVPGSRLDSPNPWHDKLRMIRYDEALGAWLISTSEGFHRLSTLTAVPERINHQPPVSVMGLNVWQKDRQGRWLCGSFSGFYVWDLPRQHITDYFTGETASEKAGPPFGAHALSGYTADIKGQPAPVDYGKGTDILPMPAELAYLPMSLWNLSLEVHTGRIYTLLGPGTLVYITFAGLLVLWCLWSGYRVRLRKKKK